MTGLDLEKMLIVLSISATMNPVADTLRDRSYPLSSSSIFVFDPLCPSVPD